MTLMMMTRSILLLPLQVGNALSAYSAVGFLGFVRQLVDSWGAALERNAEHRDPSKRDPQLDRARELLEGLLASAHRLTAEATAPSVMGRLPTTLEPLRLAAPPGLEAVGLYFELHSDLAATCPINLVEVEHFAESITLAVTCVSAYPNQPFSRMAMQYLAHVLDLYESLSCNTAHPQKLWAERIEPRRVAALQPQMPTLTYAVVS
jgi:hypothetical protein